MRRYNYTIPQSLKLASLEKALDIATTLKLQVDSNPSYRSTTGIINNLGDDIAQLNKNRGYKDRHKYG